jgi:hypothetical protein
VNEAHEGGESFLAALGLPLRLSLTVAILAPWQHRAGSLRGQVAPAARTFPQTKGSPVSGGPFYVRGDRKPAFSFIVTPDLIRGDECRETTGRRRFHHRHPELVSASMACRFLRRSAG